MHNLKLETQSLEVWKHGCIRASHSYLKFTVANSNMWAIRASVSGACDSLDDSHFSAAVYVSHF